MSHKVNIGWAAADITPEQTVNLRGQFYARVSEGVRDPITATALALESPGSGAEPVRVVWVSCDLVGIQDSLRDGVRRRVAERQPELAGAAIVLHATHTHTGPTLAGAGGARLKSHAGAWRSQAPTLAGSGMPLDLGVELPVADPQDYTDFAIGRIAEAVVEAWTRRQPGSIAYGLGHAVVGHNRRLCYEGGESRMYGRADDPAFRHVEGYEDHSLNVMATWDDAGALTGLIVNVACPSQVSEHEFKISADYWHDTRLALRERFGKNLFVLPQCAAAGDQSPHWLVGKAAEERMLALAGIERRADIARRIADGVAAMLPVLEKERLTNPKLACASRMAELTRNQVSEEAVAEAQKEAEAWREKYDAMKSELDAQPEKREEPHWYKDITMAFRRMKWYENVSARSEQAREQPRLPVELHVVRLDDWVWATNPFELYLDYGMQIRAGSPAAQTVTVQLAGAGTYLPSERSTRGGGYGSVPASNPIGPEGGRELVEHTLEMIRSLWA